MLKKIILVVIISSLFPSFSFANNTSPLLIEQIIASPKTNSSQNYSLYIKINVSEHTISKWALGFYMPRTFNTLVNPATQTNINPDLTMRICDASTPDNCTNLIYVSKHAAYKSAGYTNILAPVNQEFKLDLGKTYFIELKNSNQWLPNNYSALPQSFFLIENQSIVSIADAKPEAYNISSYDDNQIKTAVEQHIQSNWDNAKPRDTNSLADKYSLVPTPVTIQSINNSGYRLIENSQISITDEFNEAKNKTLLADYLQHDLNIHIVDKTEYPAIIIQKARLRNPEAYQLEIRPNGILIEAKTTAGVFYAIQTLRQLWQQSSLLPGLAIEDFPRFQYRGVLLDVSRHFFSVNEVEKLLDTMAAQKLNTLHLHLADDEGWRLALNTLDNLTQIGATRGFTKQSRLQPALLLQANLDISNRERFSPDGDIINHHYTRVDDNDVGFYSQQDIQTLITYANARQITIIPEIDLPGHARALIKAFPNLLTDSNDQSQFISVQGYTDDVLPVCLFNTTKGAAFTQIMNSIVTQINALFANQSTVYQQNEISIGGDEVSANAWTADASCTNYWSHLSALEKSQYFFLLLKQQQPQTLFSGWQQFIQLDDGNIGTNAVPANQTAHVWVWETTGNGADQKGIRDAARLINAGYPTVLAFADDTYFDLTYTPDKWEPGFSWAGSFLDTHASLRSAMDASQTEALLTNNQGNNLLGLEGTLWTENIPNFSHLAYMALPKMTGLAEAAWASKSTTAEDNWQSLAYRLGSHDKNGFLHYLYNTTQLKYRGFPNGIAAEVPH